MWVIEAAVIVLLGAAARAAGEAASRSAWARWSIDAVVIAAGGGALIIGTMALVAGRVEWGTGAVGVGSALLLAWWRPYRSFVARWIPIDPTSILDALGLAVLQATLVLFLSVLVHTTAFPSLMISRSQLVGQAVAEVALAFVSVGFPFSRNWSSTLERLGVTRPSWQTVGGALLFALGMFVISLLTGVLAQLMQPEAAARIAERLSPLTMQFGSPGWAILLGIVVGIGEEVLFRGAIQPRYGLLLTASLFTVLHVQYELSVVALGVFALAVLLGIERRRLGTTACILSHAVYDAVVVMLASLLW
ncbi:MAG: CPBP family intramembrane metalloprotease [Thermomicrobium sp.]|nr:CPBP family intramembrane metalloprotease [Thermomicrobium sp.]MCS7246412.1 CPBP family intramembrane metalloprotease [Thermomicrobium sp.]MDW7981930.1 CPBP family intramembrane glutamic endopeptidase [Thermomicrobium sp.]